ncbi:MAG: BtaA family protein [Aquimonas sp.]|nr:BtaA family protein [Aquimonas sp.]
MNLPLASSPVFEATPTRLRDRIDQRIFGAIYGRSLVYNACWEDPAVDRKALALGPEHALMVITSAGCNALDYALAGAGHIHCVDANPRQNALLELKLAAVRGLEYEDYFRLFGHGFHPRAGELYATCLRPQLGAFARDFFDRHWGWFCSSRGSFYFHGLSGLAARGFGAWLRLQPRLSEGFRALFAADSIEQQREIYWREIAPRMWTRTFNWMLSRQLVMNLLGVPHPQRKLVEAQHPGRIAGFIRSALEYVICELPLRDNYFWKVYFSGSYTEDCCPEYLKPEGHARLRAGIVDRIDWHTCTVTEFLHSHRRPLDRFVLLDHMDWMSSYQPAALIEEWEAIMERAAPGARILLRSAQSKPGYLDRIRLGRHQQRLRDLLVFQDALADSLQREDRVHTYAGLLIADCPANARI